MKSSDDNESNADEAVVTEVNFPSSDPTCQLYGDLTLPPSSSKVTTASDGESETAMAMALLPAIVVVNGSGVSSTMMLNFVRSYLFSSLFV